MLSNSSHTTIYLHETNSKVLRYGSDLVRSSYTNAIAFSVSFPSFWTSSNRDEWIELCRIYAENGPTILESVYSIKIVNWSLIA